MESRFLIISCAKYQKMKVNVNLNDWFDSEHLLTQCINMWMIPVKTGNIILPEVWIDGKRGIWVNSLITNVQSAQ